METPYVVKQSFDPNSDPPCGITELEFCTLAETPEEAERLVRDHFGDHGNHPRYGRIECTVRPANPGEAETWDGTVFSAAHPNGDGLQEHRAALAAAAPTEVIVSTEPEIYYRHFDGEPPNAVYEPVVGYRVINPWNVDLFYTKSFHLREGGIRTNVYRAYEATTGLKLGTATECGGLDFGVKAITEFIENIRGDGGTTGVDAVKANTKTAIEHGYRSPWKEAEVSDGPDCILILPHSEPMDLPILDNMEPGSYIDKSLCDTPQECSCDCPCWFMATRDGYRVVDACGDPARFKQMAETEDTQ